MEVGLVITGIVITMHFFCGFVINVSMLPRITKRRTRKQKLSQIIRMFTVQSG